MLVVMDKQPNSRDSSSMAAANNKLTLFIQIKLLMSVSLLMAKIIIVSSSNSNTTNSFGLISHNSRRRVVQAPNEPTGKNFTPLHHRTTPNCCSNNKTNSVTATNHHLSSYPPPIRLSSTTATAECTPHNPNKPLINTALNNAKRRHLHQTSNNSCITNNLRNKSFKNTIIKVHNTPATQTTLSGFSHRLNNTRATACKATTCWRIRSSCIIRRRSHKATRNLCYTLKHSSTSSNISNSNNSSKISSKPTYRDNPQTLCSKERTNKKMEEA